MQNWYKNVFVDATVPFELPYMKFWTFLLNHINTGFEPELFTSQVRLRTLWATKQTYRLRKHIDIKLDMCDAIIQNHQF